MIRVDQFSSYVVGMCPLIQQTGTDSQEAETDGKEEEYTDGSSVSETGEDRNDLHTKEEQLGLAITLQESKEGLKQQSLQTSEGESHSFVGAKHSSPRFSATETDDSENESEMEVIYNDSTNNSGVSHFLVHRCLYLSQRNRKRNSLYCWLFKETTEE